MTCPKCEATLRELDSVINKTEKEKYRLYKCPDCGHSIFTVEYEVEINRRFEEDWVENYINKLNTEKKI